MLNLHLENGVVTLKSPRAFIGGCDFVGPGVTGGMVRSSDKEF
jgi:hypothetical protein